MSGAAGAAGGAAAAAAVAASAARRRRIRSEEETMTPYQREDLDGFEFKILRTASPSLFRDPYRLRAALDEEAEAGQELIEKFDDTRIRLKRRTEWREKDSALSRDPYRIWAGVSPNVVAARILIGVLLAVGVCAGISSQDRESRCARPARRDEEPTLTGRRRAATKLGGMQRPSNPEVILAQTLGIVIVLAAVFAN